MSLKGENSILYIYKLNAWLPVACLTSNGLSTQLSVIESQTKCDPGLVKKTAGNFSYNISADGEIIDTTTVGGDNTKCSHDALLALQMAKTNVDFKIDTDINTVNSTKYYGTAILTSLEFTADAGDAIQTFTASLDGSGSLSLTDTHPSLTLPVVTGPSYILSNINVAVSQQIVATNTPTSYSAVGLGAFVGLSLNTVTGLITGTVTGAVDGEITVYATNAQGTSNPFSIYIIIKTP